MENNKEKRLRERLKASYETYIQQLKNKPVPDLIEMASEIAATKMVYEELMVEGSFGDCIDYLLQADDPLEKAVGCWLDDQNFDRREDIGHALWAAKETDIGRGLYIPEQTAGEEPAFSQGVALC